MEVQVPLFHIFYGVKVMQIVLVLCAEVLGYLSLKLHLPSLYNGGENMRLWLGDS